MGALTPLIFKAERFSSYLALFSLYAVLLYKSYEIISKYPLFISHINENFIILTFAIKVTSKWSIAFSLQLRFILLGSFDTFNGKIIFVIMFKAKVLDFKKKFFKAEIH